MNTAINQAVQQAVFKAMNEQSSPAPVPVKEESGGWVYIMLISVIVLVSGITFMMLTKSSRKQHPTGFAPIVQTAPDNSGVISGMGSKITDLDRRLGVVEGRQWMLGIAQNESSMISQKIGQRTDPGLAAKYPLLDEQWKLNKMPEFLRMSEEDRKALADQIRR